MENQIVSTSENIPINTNENVWYGLSTSIDDIIHEYASRRYYFTLTGDADGTTDIEIPISSFQCRRRNGESTYLQVVIPSVDYADYITDRPNGDLVIEMSYWFNGGDNFRTEIARGTLDSISLDEGGKNQSITLSGYKTETFVPKSITASGSSTYRSLRSGKLTHRFSEPDIYINPGDIVTVGTDTFTIGNVTFAVSTTSQTVELNEA